MKMGVVADDITGSNDIGIMFALSGCLAYVYSYPGSGSFQELSKAYPPADIYILDTNSRLDAPEVAYSKVFAATRELQTSGCRQFFNKTCSVFRGNIGVEFDAMLDALSEEFAIVVLGFPKNGRLTVDGIHYVHGRRLEESEFRHDPIHPMRRSSLVEILQLQTRRKVALVDHTWVRQGAIALRARLMQMRSESNYVILDVTRQADLGVIAEAVHDFPVLCGSSSLAETLPEVWGLGGNLARPAAWPKWTGRGLLCVAGSLMPQTAAQIQHLLDLGVHGFALDTLQLFDPASRQAQIEALVQAISSRLVEGQDALLHTPYQPQAVAETRAAGERAGLSPTETSRLVSGIIAEITAQTLERSGQNRLVVAGGETSAAVCARLGVNGMMIWKEIQPGLPSCLSLSAEPRLLVLKSGSFGSPEFLAQALEHLRTE